MANETISVNKKTVRELLTNGKDNPFVIPEYQRPYAWTDEEVVTLFDDLWEFTVKFLNKEETEKTYFLGSVVSYKNEKGELEIIDGQQRITSLFLLLRAIYTKLKAEESDKRSSNFINQIEPAIWETDKLTSEVDYTKILIRSNVMNDDGNEILRNILKTGKAEKNAKDNYSKNYNKFIELYENAAKDNPTIIYDFIYAVLNQAIVLPIIADDQDTALTIFSTLNNRGLPLCDSDIFKAKIYNHISDDREKRDNFIKEWKKLTDEAEYAEESIQQLFYYYMFYLRAKENDPKTTTPGLRKYFTDKEHKNRLYEENILDNLNKILNLWKVVNKREEIEDEKWSKNLKIKKILDELKSYPNEFWKYPVITYYLTYKDTDNFENEFLTFLRRFLTFLIVKYLESPTINAVKTDIMKLNIDITKTSHPTFNSLEINTEEFKNSLKKPHTNTVRMLLKIMAYLDGEQSELLPKDWEIEHIFPRSWRSNYFTDKSDDEVIEKIEHLGNKVPFNKRLNIVAGNGYFDKKKSQYKNSNIKIVKNMGLSSRNDWNLEDIDNRDEEIATSIQNLFNKWINDYDNNKKICTPSEEELKMIEQLRAKGLI